MCGIAGVVDLAGARPIETALLTRMADAIRHRGPDETGQLRVPGLGLVSRRLSILGLADGCQPIFNEDRSVAVVYNGELFDYPEQRAELTARGHRFRTSTDTEVLVHRWEDHQEGFFEHLRGQFAFALVDLRRRLLIVARHRLGICPLYVSRQGDWLYLGSEIKALLASGGVPAEVDRQALDHVFSFFAMGTRRTMFRGVQAVLPGSYLRIALGDRPALPQERFYWDLAFPDAGTERQDDPARLAEEFGDLLTRSVERRLRADVPVVSYLSGGVDSSTVAWLASRSLGRPIPTFTIRIRRRGLDETPRTRLAARAIGTDPVILECGEDEIAAGYRDLTVASECPVIDTSAAAIHQLAGAVHAAGYKVALTGEGADEALAGYPWFKIGRLMAPLDRLGAGESLRRRFFHGATGGLPWEVYRRRYAQMGGAHATSDLYAICSLSGYQIYSAEQLTAMAGHTAADDLVMDREQMRRWDPLNRSLYLGYKVMLAGLLMTHKGDRPAMAHSVEARFPFLDEDVVAFCATLAPRYKLRGWRRDKDLLRRFAGGFLPAAVALRPKHIFRAPYSASFFNPSPPWVDQLMSDEAVRRTGYFDPGRVRSVRKRLGGLRPRLGQHMRDEVSLVGVLSTQLWHHLFLGGGLCELPPWTPPA